MKNNLYEFLKRPNRVRTGINNKRLQIENLRQTMLPGAIRYDKDKVQSSAQDPMLVYAERLSELEEQLRAMEMQFIEAQKAVSEAIERVPDENEQTVLMHRYINGLYFDEIAKRIPASISSVYRWHRLGLINIQEQINTQGHK